MNNGTSNGNSIDDTLKELDLDTIINEGETNGNQESNADADVDTGIKLPPPNIQETQTKDESEGKCWMLMLLSSKYLFPSSLNRESNGSIIKPRRHKS